jgi:transposase
MNDVKYIGFDVHQATSVVAVTNRSGKIVAESIIETKANTIVDFLKSQRGTLCVTFEEGTYAHWLYDLMRPHVSTLVVCDPRKNRSMQQGTKSDKTDARRLAELLRTNALSPVYHGEESTKTLKELARSYTGLVGDVTRVKNRIKAIFRSRGIDCAGETIYSEKHHKEWLIRLKEEGVRCRAERLFAQLKTLEQLREQASDDMVRESRKHSASKILQTIPGLGPVRTALIIAIVMTPYRFRTKRQFWTYAGLSVVTSGSAEYEMIQGHVRRSKKSALPRGLNRNHNHVLKEVFKSAALTAVVRGPFQERCNEMVKQGTEQNLALLTIARKISSVTLSLWKKGERYDPDRNRLAEQAG